ncbi:hypothetical protein CRE_15247 [Caenorhabditis remanei]|uniref:Uncharacterized protein n=1 Tax=Caenorhabditis remanei TaxID=31234 RepID=E3NV41_CAERE|nr:hypothetical protein CRE_15247 [Caenorhabditis remanei]
MVDNHFHFHESQKRSVIVFISSAESQKRSVIVFISSAESQKRSVIVFHFFCRISITICDRFSFLLQNLKNNL